MDRKGVSVLVGFILLVLTLMIFLSILQAYMVPGMCKDAEVKHLNRLIDEVQQLKENLLENKLATVTLDLGMSYPKYPMLLTPPTMSSLVKVERMPVRMSFELLLPNGSWIPWNIDTYTDDLMIVPNYFYSRGIGILLENTAILRLRNENGNWKYLFSYSDQSSFTSGGIRIVLLNSTFSSFSASQPVDLALVPISYGGKNVVRNFTITFETSCPDYWRSLKDELESMGYNISVTGKNVTVVFKNETTLEVSYCMLYKGISIQAKQFLGNFANLREPFRMFPTDQTILNVLLNESKSLGVIIMDKFTNPVSGVVVNVNLTGVGEVTPPEVITDSNGIGYAIFKSNRTGNAIVNFSSKYGLVSYKLHVIGTGVSAEFPYGVTFDANRKGALFAYGNSVSSNPPISNMIPSTPLTNTTNITKDDGIYLVSIAKSLNNYSAQRFEIFGLNTTNVIETYVYWNGYGVGYGYSWWWWFYNQVNGETLYLWNYTSNRYDYIVSTDSPNEIWLSVGLNQTQMKNYIKNGEMIVLVVQRGRTIEIGRTYYYSELATDYIAVLQIFK